jgi:DnaJ-class molecular chaperone
MSVQHIRCHCKKNALCKLCRGTGMYDYTVTTAGYIPFQCPTCEGKRNLADGTACPTCRGQGNVDPADPPPAGWLDVMYKTLMGA